LHAGARTPLRLQHRDALMRVMFVVYLSVIVLGLVVLLVLGMRHA
jgi:hypothetical protein